MSHLLRLLVRETIEASSSSSPGATPSTDTAPSSPEKDKEPNPKKGPSRDVGHIDGTGTGDGLLSAGAAVA